ncbi:MAG: hypothetical protein J1F12_03345 [Muribaculaceae bacterium]|nr:hypothetical protein [Muribaculaceae bacterium]
MKKNFRKSGRNLCNYLTFLICLVVAFSCGKKREHDENILLRYGDRYITYEEVEELIPEGVTGNDSIALFKAIVDNWLTNEVLADFAEERLYDTRDIDRRVKEYRNSLIVLEYLTGMRESRKPKVDEVRIREYYDQHKKDLILEVPLVKGIFMKINSGTSGKENIRMLLDSEDPEKLDRLEREWLDRSLEYNYFRDKWIDWETLAGLIPYRFGDADKFLNETKYFETEYGDCNYYLRIYEYLPSGSIQPYEFAKSWITDLLTQGEIAEYERALVNSLVKKSIDEEKLETIGYDPINHILLEN